MVGMNRLAAIGRAVIGWCNGGNEQIGCYRQSSNRLV